MLKTTVLISIFSGVIFCQSVHAETKVVTLCRPTNVSRVQRVTQNVLYWVVPSCKTPPSQTVNFNMRESLNNSILLNNPTYIDNQENYYLMRVDGTTLVYKKPQRTK
jgi:hypothetical protein